VLGELCRGGAQDFPQHPRLELQPPDLGRGLGHLRARLAVKPHRLGILAQLDADLGKDALGRRLDLRQAFVRQDVVGGNAAGDIGPVHDIALRPRLAPLVASAALALAGIPVRHGWPLHKLAPE